MISKNIRKVSNNIVSNLLITGGVTTNLSHNIKLSEYNSLRHSKVVY